MAAAQRVVLEPNVGVERNTERQQVDCPAASGLSDIVHREAGLEKGQSADCLVEEAVSIAAGLVVLGPHDVVTLEAQAVP